MKRFISIIAVFSVVCVLFCSCEKNGNGDAVITMKSEEKKITADDGTVVYTGSVSYPELTGAADKESVYDMINAAIGEIVKTITEPEFDYIAEYNDFVARGADYFSGASYSISFSQSFRDDERLSFRLDYYNHGACAVRDTEDIKGITFSLKTGDTLALDDITGNMTVLKEMIKEECRVQFARAGNDGEPIEYSKEELDYAVDSGEFSWYLTEENLVILFEPGSIAPIIYQTPRAEIAVERIPGSPER